MNLSANLIKFNSVNFKKNKITVEALYLPQFHRFDENDSWWGNGYTEWNNVKSAKKLHKKHKLKNSPTWGFYDLSDVQVMKMQYKHAKEIGVDVFSVYHYWSDGSLLMETPVENLLANKNIEFKYYLNWANHSFFNKIHFTRKKILWAQKYNIEGITKHVDYLWKHMQDERYYRVNGRPVLNVYDPINIPEFSNYMNEYRRIFIEKYNITIHLRVTLKDYKDVAFVKEHIDIIDSVYEYNPYYINHSKKLRFYIYEFYLRSRRDILKVVSTFNAKSIVTRIVKSKKAIEGIQYGFGVYTGWDTTPRWGKRGIIHIGMDNNLIKSQIDAAATKAEINDFVVIAAWNEWGEGAILEPCD